MSNDVQVARVARISSDVMRRQGKQQRDISKGGGGGVMGDDIEFVFGSISPRGGGPSACLGQGQQKHVVGSYELDSPEHTQRDTTESDNNISSCSTLDIVNKVSCKCIYIYVQRRFVCICTHVYNMYACVCVCVCALRTAQVRGNAKGQAALATT